MTISRLLEELRPTEETRYDEFEAFWQRIEVRPRCNGRYVKQPQRRPPGLDNRRHAKDRNAPEYLHWPDEQDRQRSNLWTDQEARKTFALRTPTQLGWETQVSIPWCHLTLRFSPSSPMSPSQRIPSAEWHSCGVLPPSASSL